MALTTNSRVSLSENSGDGGPPREAATSPSDGHLVDEDPEDDEDVSPDKDIGRSSEEQLKVACKKKRKKRECHSSKLIAQILDSFFKKCKRKD